nr:acrosin-like [Anolis sagrei ordinatus]
MKWPPSLFLILSVFGSTRAQDDRCNGICGRRPLAPSHGGSVRIIGGTDTLPGTWPWIVSIQTPSHRGYTHICGGSLISSRWVMTAAHCFLDKRFMEHWKLVIGATQLSRPSPDIQERTIKNLVEHQHYQKHNHLNDIALLELSQPINCTDYVQLACLPDSNVEVQSLTHCYISGWGVTDISILSHILLLSERQTSDILQEAKVNLIPLELCNSTYWYNSKIHFNNLCAGYQRGGIDTCQGDSGGPLVCRAARSERFWVVGVTSWGAGCGRAQRPGVYTSTQHFLDWIKAGTKENLIRPGGQGAVKPKPSMPRPVGQPWYQTAYRPTTTAATGNWMNPWPQPNPTPSSPPLTWREPTLPKDEQEIQNWLHAHATPRPPPPPLPQPTLAKDEQEIQNWLQAQATSRPLLRPTMRPVLTNPPPWPPPLPSATQAQWGTSSGWNQQWATPPPPPPLLTHPPPRPAYQTWAQLGLTRPTRRTTRHPAYYGGQQGYQDWYRPPPATLPPTTQQWAWAQPTWSQYWRPKRTRYPY